MSRCAILGGTPVRERPIPWGNTMGVEERNAVDRVMDSGVLSAFLASAGEQFLGGPNVRELEENFCGRFHVGYAVSFNSASTALQAAVAACNIGPGDEVLVSPYTMTASASCILLNGAVPVFVDVHPETYNMDPARIEEWITPRTKAILTVNLFGLPSALPEILAIAKKNGLFVIEDNSQSPGATVNGRESGTFGDIGVYSLNYHKIVHSGEGGVAVTGDPALAERCRLVRNHGEVVLDQRQDEETVAVGSNYRMSELHAAIGVEQLKKLDGFLAERRILAAEISRRLRDWDGLSGVTVPDGYTHSYYVYPLRFHSQVWGISRGQFAAAMAAEGFPLGTGYVKPIYLMNLYQHKHMVNRTTYPFALTVPPTQEYKMGLCPVTEELHFKTLLTADICRCPFKLKEIEEFFEAVQKVWEERDLIMKIF